MAKKKSAEKKSANSSAGGGKRPAKNSLVANINRRKKAGKSRDKKDSTISSEAYADMKENWPKKKRE